MSDCYARAGDVARRSQVASIQSSALAVISVADFTGALSRIALFDPLTLVLSRRERILAAYRA